MSTTPAIALAADRCELVIDEKGRLTFSLEGQYRWVCPGSLLVLHYYDRQHPRAQSVAVPWSDDHAFGTPGTLSRSATAEIDLVSRTVQSAQLRVAFPSLQVSFTVVFELDQDGTGFRVRIDDADIEEGHPALYRVLGVEVLPMFGAATTCDEGYLVLPNWSGCQTFFDKTYPREIWQTIYSSNDQWEHACSFPVFGMQRAQGTMCGIVSQGDTDAQLVSRVHWEALKLNATHPHLVWRWRQEDDRLPGPREVRYSFAPPDSSFGEGYVFVGSQYRDWLRSERGVESWNVKKQSRPDAEDYRGRFFLKVFLAYKDPHPEGRGAYHCTCTLAEARGVLEDCLARGLSRLTVTLVGWGQDGHDGQCPTYLPVDDRVGGDEGMCALTAWCNEHDIQLALHTSHSAAYRCSPEFDAEQIVRHHTGEMWESVIWSGGQAMRLCPQVALQRYLTRDIPKLKGLGLHGHHHVDAEGSFMPCHHPDHALPQRGQYIDAVRGQFDYLRQQMGSVSTEVMFGPYLDLLDGFFHSYTDPYPWQRSSPPGQFFLDRSIPLASIALNGSHKLCEAIGGAQRLLHLLDFGLRPQCEVCVRPSPAFGIPAYADMADGIEEAYRMFYGPDGMAAKLDALDIVSRIEDGKLRETIYSDGTRIRVNLDDQPCGGIAPGSYEIQSGADEPTATRTAVST